MGEWCNVAFVRGSVSKVARALTHVMGESGRVLVPSPPPRKPPRSDPMQYGDGPSAPLWGIAIAPGARGWVIVKTAPFELLCERPEPTAAPRLAALAKHLSTEAFQVNLYDGTALTLLEANESGKVRACGYTAEDPTRWQGFEMTEYEPSFELLTDIPKAAREALEEPLLSRGVERMCSELGGENVAFADNLTNVHVLLTHEPLRLAGGRSLYFERAAVAPKARPALPLRMTETTFAPAKARALLSPAPWGGWPEHRRLSLFAGKGEAWLVGASLVAPDAKAGAAFLDALAAWMGVDAPAPARGPVILAAVFATMEQESPDTWLLHVGERRRATLRLRLGKNSAELTETDPAPRDQLLQILAPALRDGVRPAKTRRIAPFASAWRRFTDEPVHVASGAGFAGESLVAGVWRGWKGAALICEAPGATPRDLVTFGGMVSTLVPSPLGDVAAACITFTKRHEASPCVGSDDDAAIVLVNLKTGALRTLAEDAGPFTKIVWSPDGASLAFEEKRPGGRPPVVVVGVRTKKLVWRGPAGAAATTWDADGLVLAIHDYRTFGPTTYLRWSGDKSITQIERPASEGRLRVSKSTVIVEGDEPMFMDLTTGKTRPLAPPTRSLTRAAVSASGKRVAAYLGAGTLLWSEVT